ncbi:MAG: hypothetical protein FJY95_10125 [Candidatus Handelsmanbacteria bacterium]|nr:hypothetical protein [Candidatus Handelsmanbacteria bacterium]
MERIIRLPARPLALFELDSRRLVAALSEGLALLDQGVLTYLDRDAIDGVAHAPDGSCYWTCGDRIFRLEPGAAGPEEVTARFAGRPQGQRQVSCTGDGDLWVEGCATRRQPSGQFVSNPAAPTVPWSPAACLVDIYGNYWSLVETERGAQVLVAPANVPGEWQVAGPGAGEWRWLAADNAGYLWLAGAGGWRRFCPRQPEAGWQDLSADLPRCEVTAVGRSPDDLVMAAFADGSVVELDATAAGATVVRPLGSLPVPARCLLADRSGALWAGTDAELYRRAPAPDAWQHTWQAPRGRLPGGGNHDIFAAPCQGRLYVAGGWACQWGLPVRYQVPDALLAYDPRTECWEVVSRMYMPRRYNGIAALGGRVWIIGGEARFGSRGGPHQALYLVDIYDPASDSWEPGPSLNHVRTDPFVVTCEGRIWAIGGARHNSGPMLDTVESIGPGERTWREEPPLPRPTRQGHACALEGIIYCFSIDGAFAFDTRTARWDEDLPQPGEIGQGPLAAAWQGEAWLIGGYRDRSIRCYNPTTRTWRRGPDLPVEQAWAAAAVLEGRLYIVGGAHYSQSHDAVVFDDRTFVLR